MKGHLNILLPFLQLDTTFDTPFHFTTAALPGAIRSIVVILFVFFCLLENKNEANYRFIRFFPNWYRHLAQGSF